MADRSTPPIQLVVITGLSGAGKTEAMRAFEDMNYYCIDNLPPALIPTVATLCRQASGGVSRVAVVIDIRGGEFFDSALQSLDALANSGIPYHILFLEADEETLVRRYRESRRRHPLAPQGRVVEGIAEERRRLMSLRARADRIVDTSGIDRYALRKKLREMYAGDSQRNGLQVTLLSFGFKHGLPMDADMVFDLRLLPNPYYEPSLRPLTGLDPAVREYVLGSPQGRMVLEQLANHLDNMLPLYEASGREHLLVTIGCTGGRHRSVVMVEELAARLRKKFPNLTVQHRDISLPAEIAGQDEDDDA